MKRVKTPGLRRRGAAYYFRFTEYVTEGGRRRRRETWTALGTVAAETRAADEARVLQRWREANARAEIRVAERELPRKPHANVTVARAVARWLAGRIAMKRNPAGVALARRRAALYLIPFFGKRPLSSVTREDLEQYAVWLSGRATSVAGRRVGRALATQTVRHVLSDAKCFFRWTVLTEYLTKSPVPDAWLPRAQEVAPQRLTDEEVAQLLTVEEPYRFAIRLLLTTGLRWGEMVRATTADVVNGRLAVTRQTKNKRVRYVPLPPGLLDGRKGALVPFQDATSFARTVCRKSGLDGKEGRTRFHPHQLRHTFACRWVEKGGSVTALQKILGHSDLALTLRYARQSDASVQAEYARLVQL